MGTLNGWGRKQFAPAGNANAFMESARKEIGAKHRGNAAFRLIEKGKVHDEYFVGDSVDSETCSRSPRSVNGSAPGAS